MNRRLNFLNWSLGYEARWAVELETDRAPGYGESDHTVRRWVQVEDGPRMNFQYRGRTHYLKFGSKAEEREARGWLKEVPEPFLMRVEFNATPDAGIGSLVFMRGNDPAVMTVSPRIVVTDEVLSDSGIPDRGSFVQQVADRMLIESPQGLLMVAQVPMLVFHLFSSPGEPAARIFLAGGGELECDIAGSPGVEYLVVRKIDNTRNGPGRLPFAKFIKVPEAPMIASSPENIQGTFLDAFRGRRHEFLEAWLAYENAESHFKKHQFESKIQHPLEYELSGSLDEQKCFPLRLIRASNVEKWVDIDQLNKNDRVDIDYCVEIRPAKKTGTGKPDETNVRGRLKAFVLGAKSDKAFFEPDQVSIKNPLPQFGYIVAVEDFQDQIQHGRRRAAMECLLKGATQIPGLLEYLGRPESIPAVPGKGINYWQRPGGPVLTGPMQEALVQAAKEPHIFMVQGPPGTGKTTLIAELIHQILHRRRNRRGDSATGGGAARILISSIQNPTIENVCDRLRAQGLQVDLIAKDQTAASEGDLRLCCETAEKVIAGLETSPLFTRIKHLMKLNDRLKWVAESVTSDHLFEALNELLQIDAAAALTPALKSDLKGLVEQYRQTSTEMVRTPATNSDGNPPEPSDNYGGLPPLLEEFLSSSGSMNLETAQAILPILDRLLQFIPTLGENAPEIIHWAESNISSLRHRLEACCRRGELNGKDLETWRVSVEAARACTPPLPVDPGIGAADHNSEAAAAQTRAAGDWIERAMCAAGMALKDLEKTDEYTLLGWAGILQNEPVTMRKLKARHTPFRASTCQKAKKALNPLRDFDEPGRRSTLFYDIVIIDEAARAGIDILIPMVLARSVILIGDHRQLPPYLEKKICDRMEQEYKENVDLTQDSMFSRLWQRAPESNRVKLTMQYRMHEDIGRVVSKVFYEPEIRLEHHFSGKKARERSPAFGLCDNLPLVWVDTSDELQGNGTPKWHWPCQEKSDYEAELIFSLLSAADVEALKRANAGRTEPAVGVISFYKDQVSLIESFLDRLPPGTRQMIQVGTVDGFQGKEFPLVVLSTVRSNRNGSLGFLTLPHRINVALSRAQRQLIILGDSKTLTAKRGKTRSSKLGDVFDILSDPSWPGMVVGSREVFL